MSDPVPKCRLSVPPEVIVFIASLLDRAFLLIYQPFIFDAQCMQRVQEDPKYMEMTNRSAEYICQVAVKSGNGNSYGPEIRRLERDVSADTSRWVFYLALCRYVPGFFADSILGPIGDHFSRKLALMIPTVGLVIMSLVSFAIANYFYKYYYLVLLGVLIYGITGQHHGIIAGVLAYAAHHSAIDATSERAPITKAQQIKEMDAGSKRNENLDETVGEKGEPREENSEQSMSLISSTRLSILHGLYNMGIAVGLLTGGLIVSWIGPARAFGFVAILALLAFFIVWFGVKDLPASKEQSYGAYGEGDYSRGALWVLRMLFVFTSDAYYATFCKPRHASGRTILMLLVIALLAFVFCYELHPYIDYLYLSLSPRSFSPELYGVYSMLKYSSVAISLFTLLPAIYYIFRDRHYFTINVLIAAAGMIMLACAYLMLAIAQNKWMTFLSLPFDAFNALTYSSIRIIIANLVPTSDVGKTIVLYNLNIKQLRIGTNMAIFCIINNNHKQ